jgi:integrase
MACKVKRHKKSRFLIFRLFYNGMRFWEGTKLEDTPQNRQLAEARALIISQEMKDGTFDYLRHFPSGNKRYLFVREQQRPASSETVETYYEKWILRQENSALPHQFKEYKSQITNHILPTRVDGMRFGTIPLSALTTDHLAKLQAALRAKRQPNGEPYKASSINAFIGGSLRAMLRDARRSHDLTVDLFELFDPLPLTDKKNSIDPYDPGERELILEAFRLKRPQYFAFVYHQFWTGCRPSEACYLRRCHVDLRYGWERFEGSHVQGHEHGSKNVRSNREHEMRDGLVDVMKAHLAYDVSAEWMAVPAPDPDGYVFTTPSGAAITEDNFYKREWLPMLRRLKLRPRPFYNTRHSYISFMLSSGRSALYVSKQTGDRIQTLETNYAKYQPEADIQRDMIEASIKESAERVRTSISTKIAELFAGEQEKKKPLRNKGLKLERVRRVELPTLCLASIRSSQLSYTRLFISTTATSDGCQFHHARPSLTRPWRNRKNCT